MLTSRIADDDEDLLAAVARHDARAFGVLVSRYLDTAFRVAMKMLGQRQEAEDVVQEVFLKLWRDAATLSLRGDATFKTWLGRVVSNASIDALRRRGRLPQGSFGNDGVAPHIEAVDPQPLPLEHYAQQALAGRIDSAIAGLPLRQRTAIALVYGAQLSYREAAQALEISEPALDSLLFRARTALKRAMVKQEESP